MRKVFMHRKLKAARRNLCSFLNMHEVKIFGIIKSDFFLNKKINLCIDSLVA